MSRRYAVLAAFGALAILAGAGAAYAAGEYTNTKLHYTCKIPTGWNDMPDARVKEVSAVTEEFDPVNIAYEAAFDKELSIPGTGGAFIFIRHVRADKKINSKISEALFRSREDREMQPSLSDLLRAADGAGPAVDIERSMVFSITTADIEGAGKYKFLKASCPGKSRMVEICCFSPENEYEDNLVAFYRVIDSFKYEFGFGYSESRETAKKAGRFAGRVVVILAVVGLGLVIIIFIVTRIAQRLHFKRRPKQFPPNAPGGDLPVPPVPELQTDFKGEEYDTGPGRKPQKRRSLPRGEPDKRRRRRY